MIKPTRGSGWPKVAAAPGMRKPGGPMSPQYARAMLARTAAKAGIERRVVPHQTTPTGRLVFHVLGAIDEFQRELIIEGTREGSDAVRARGRTGGRKPKLSAAKAATVRRMYQAARPDGKRLHTVAEIAGAVGVHRTTVYDYLNKEG